MIDQLVVLGDIKLIKFGEICIEHGIAGESSYRMLTIESGSGSTFGIKLCGDDRGLRSICDEELDRFIEEWEPEWDACEEDVNAND
jgi:hypothetical protein